MKVHVEYVEGIPHWFTWLYHKKQIRRCRKVGHTFTRYRSCDHCGGYLSEVR